MSALSGNSTSVPKLELPIERFELSCGAVLLVSRRPGAPVIAVYAHMRGGPALDPIGREGSAYMTGALADQGTRRHDEEEIANLLEPAGGEVSGDASGLSGSIVLRDTDMLLDILCEELVEPAYPVEKIERQKKRLLDRLFVEKDEPRTQGGLLFRKLVYGDHWLGRPAYGSIESVRRIEAKHLRAYHRENWVGKRAIIALCGDVDPVTVRKKMEKRLASWNPGVALATTPPCLPARATRVDVFRADRQQVHLYLGHLGVRRGDPDYAALVVMDHVLGTGPGFTNRISRKLRDELGLAYSVNASIHSSAGILPGMFTAYIGTSPEHVDTAVKGFLAEIEGLQSSPPSHDELEVAKNYLIGSFPLGFERAARRAGYMVSAELHRFPADNLERLLREFAAVTADDVQRVARTHLHPRASCLVASGSVRREDLMRAIASPLATKLVTASRGRRAGAKK